MSPGTVIHPAAASRIASTMSGASRVELVFADRLAWVRGESYRTAKISMPFKLLGDGNMLNAGMVPRGGAKKCL